MCFPANLITNFNQMSLVCFLFFHFVFCGHIFKYALYTLSALSCNFNEVPLSVSNHVSAFLDIKIISLFLSVSHMVYWSSNQNMRWDIKLLTVLTVELEEFIVNSSVLRWTKNLHLFVCIMFIVHYERLLTLSDHVIMVHCTVNEKKLASNVNN